MDIPPYMVDYEYDGKKSYSYSRFQGKEFLQAYKLSRKDAMDVLDGYEVISPEDLGEQTLKFFEICKYVGDIGGHAIVSINLAFEYLKNKDIRFLNASLKANDFLCKNLEKIKSKFIKRCIYTSLFYEMQAVEELAKEKGVKID